MQHTRTGERLLATIGAEAPADALDVARLSETGDRAYILATVENDLGTPALFGALWTLLGA